MRGKRLEQRGSNHYKRDDETIALFHCYETDDGERQEVKLEALLMDELNVIGKEAAECMLTGDLLLCNKHYAEASVKQMSRSLPCKTEKYELSEHGYHFSINSASDKYFLICHMSTRPLMRIRLRLSSREHITTLREMVDLSGITTIKISSIYDLEISTHNR